MCFSRSPCSSDRSRGPPPAVVLFSGGMALSFRGGVVPGLRHRRQSGQGTAPTTGRTQRHGTVTRLCSRPQVHAAHVPERRGTLVGCQGRLLTVCLFLG